MIERFVKSLGTAQAILIGIVLGVLLGVLLGPSAEVLSPLGKIFISLLKLIVLPLIFSSIVVGVYQTGNMIKLGAMGGRTAIYYFSTTGLALFIGIVLVNLIQPGVGVDLGSVGLAHTLPPPPTFSDFIVRLFPSNLFQAFVEMNILAIIIFAVMLGIALIYLGKKGEALVKLMKSLEDVFLVLTKGIMHFAPFGVVGLMAPMIGTFGFDIFASFGKFVVVVLLGLSIHAFIVLPLIFKLFSNRNIRDYTQNLKKPFLTAFSTASSSATLPVSITAAKRNQIKDETAGFVLPLGATINMDGTALYEAVVAIFIAQSLGIELSIAQQLTVFLVAMMASVGAAGIPSAGLVTLLLVLDAVGLPAVGLGILFAIDRPLDMCRTTVNVWGDHIGCAVVEGKNSDAGRSKQSTQS